MSVFTDFQEAWAHRFPGCELPQAWEDDVRANLDKHKQRLVSLREELEKEEFYVEYLERLLQDVERAKRSSMSGSETMRSDQSGKQSDECPSECEFDAKVNHRSILNCNSDPKTEKTVEELNGDNYMPATTDYANPSEIQGNDTNSSDRSLKRKDNPYVTVIEVNGESNRREKNLIKVDEDNIDVKNSVKSNKKVPPKPPPKRPRQRSVEQSDSGHVARDDSPPVDGVFHIGGERQPVSISSSNPCNFSTFKPQLSVESTDSTPSSSLERGVTSKDNFNDRSLGKGKSRTISSGSDEKIENDALVKVESKLNDYDDDDTIYDTVPFEGEMRGSNQDANKHVKFDDVEEDPDPEGDYVVLSDKSSEHDTHDPDSPNYSNYVNIDYFLRERVVKKDEHGITRLESITLDNCCVSDDEEGPSPSLIRSVSSDPELDINGSNSGTISSGASSTGRTKQTQTVKEDVYDIDSGVYSSSVESASFIYSSSGPPTPPAGKQRKNDSQQNDNKLEAERLTMYKCILNSIIESETIYVECLTVMLQYMKALKATLTTSQPVISSEDFNSIFHKIPELHALHHSFLEGLRDHLEQPDRKPSIGVQFKMLAGKLYVYGAFLQNYNKAVDAIRRCNAGAIHFSEITKTIKLKTLKGQALTLEELLHKPVARVQKNALVLHDLLKYTPEDQPDHASLKSALKLTQNFLNGLNMTANEGMFPSADRTQRHLVKNSFIVELSEGNRKLRHLFLFNDVIICAKYKPSSRQKFTFEVKWYIPLSEILLTSPEHDGEIHIRESSSVDVLTLKARATTVREHILREERLNLTREKPKSAVKNLDKHRKKLAELEAQLVLASPNLVFRIGHKSGKMYTFFLGSEFDRSQWTEALKVLHTSASPNPPVLSVMELQAWIASCRQHLGGSFLFRSGLDEDLLVGALHISISSLQNIIRPGDLFICFEVDSFGHFFRKAKTKTLHCKESAEFKQDFIIDLEGSQSLRIICYEQQKDSSNQTTGLVIRGKTALELSRSWLNDRAIEKSFCLNEMSLTVTLKFISNDVALRRMPVSRTVGSFGMKVNQVCKKEKSNVPFLIVNCVNEVERRGMNEVGIYRVSGSASDVQRLKKGFETNVYETEQLLKDLDIHATTGLLKLYLRELPEAVFTDLLYPKFFDAFSNSNQEQKSKSLQTLFSSLPQINQNVISYLIDHMVRVNKEETFNKMSLHNLATVFGPTLLRPGSSSLSNSPSDLLAASTIDVMAQAGILYFFLKRKAAGLQLTSKQEDACE